MDIRIINKNYEIINVNNLSIMTMDKWLVGMNDRMETIKIEEYENKEKAKDRLIALGAAIEDAYGRNVKNLLIRT